ncbi:Gfo/Idh/MocA family oxidoreductase [Cellulosimicrobium terreum]|nr:Gfo/Idh/MocA family oxidoreductase [Cellulosimicrobium terreum]
MPRLALVGLDSSHADHYVRLLNAEARLPGARITEIVDGEPARRAALAHVAGLPDTTSSLEDAARRVDGAIVAHREGDRHATAVRTLVDAGVPVLVDKPFATSSVEARATLAYARRHRTAVTTASALRFAPDVVAMRLEPGERSGVSVEVTCPADPNGPYGGLFFLGIHGVEAARAVVGSRVGAVWGAVAVVAAEGTVTATTSLDGVPVRLRLVDPAHQPDAGFAVRVRRGDDDVHRTIGLGRDYLAPVVDHALEVVDAGPPGGAADGRQVVADLELLEEILVQLSGSAGAPAGPAR